MYMSMCVCLSLFMFIVYIAFNQSPLVFKIQQDEYKFAL